MASTSFPPKTENRHTEDKEQKNKRRKTEMRDLFLSLIILSLPIRVTIKNKIKDRIIP